MPKFTVDGTEYDLINEDRMTFAEARAFEAKSGETLQAMASGDGLSANSLQAMLWVSMKRKAPELKFSDLDDMSIGSISWVEDESAEGVEPDPTEPVEAEPSSSAA